MTRGAAAIEVLDADITRLTVDAIVNAANERSMQELNAFLEKVALAGGGAVLAAYVERSKKHQIRVLIPTGIAQRRSKKGVWLAAAVSSCAVLCAHQQQGPGANPTTGRHRPTERQLFPRTDVCGVWPGMQSRFGVCAHSS